ncbi:MAG: hypothetical protein IJU70_04185 [Lentisphaeria bacterium]|nr:hypothetical protein [Lentisphaeria bacterium]
MDFLYSRYKELFPELVSCLGNAKSHGRFAHAFLVSSPDPVVRREFSVVLAQIAGCPAAAETGVPDQDCPYCRKMADLSYEELHTLSPVGKMYQIKVGDRVNPEPNKLRSFISAFHLTSTSVFSRKIGMIFEADRMNDEAQNALLKTLEEPPPETTLILSTGNPSALLPTTISRCQLVPLPGNVCSYAFAGAEEVFAALESLCFGSGGLAAAERAAAVLIRVAGGLAAAAKKKVDEEYAGSLSAAGAAEDPAYLKRLEERVADAANGEYMRERRVFLSAVLAFCQQVFLLSRGVVFSDLANPELFVSGPPDCGLLTREAGDLILKEAEDLALTLRFNVPEELALRTFAVNLSMRGRKQVEHGHSMRKDKR